MKKLLYVGCAIVTLGIVVFAVGFLTSGSNIYALNIETDHFLIDLDGSSSDTTTDSQTFSPSEIDSIRVEDSWHDINVGISDDGLVHVSYAQENGDPYSVGLDNGVLNIDYNSNQRHKFKLFSINLGRGSDSTLEILLPEGFEPQMDVQCASGNTTVHVPSISSLAVESQSGYISVGDISCGIIDLSSSSGYIELGRVSVLSDCSLGTSSGDIDAVSIAADTLSMRAISGYIYMDGAAAREVTASSTSGDIEISSLTVQESAQFSAVSGDISLSFAGGSSSYSVSAASTSGSIDIDQGLTGGEVPIYISTTSGNIDVYAD